MTSSEIAALFEGLNSTDFDWVDPLAPAPTKIETHFSAALEGAVTSALPSVPAPPSAMPSVLSRPLLPAGGAGEPAVPLPPCYEEQHNTYKKIHAKFTSNVRQVMLCAQMQSGKTGIFLALALYMLAHGLVDRVVIICGSNETELHTQLLLSIVKIITKFGGVYARASELADKIEAYKSTGKPYGLDAAPAIDKNTLVIWDESHFAQTTRNRPFKYLLNSGLTVGGTAKSEARWAAKNCYFLSVSATPFAEFSDSHNAEFKAQIRRQIVWHIPAANYRGVGYYHERGCIQASYTITGANSAKFTDLLTSFHGVKKYALVRSRNLSVVRACCVAAGVKFLEYTSKAKDIKGIDSLSEEPAQFTVIGVKGMCRMGKVVPKRFIGFVFEESKTSNTDCILQSFLGRMCGHNSEEDPYPETDAKIFVPNCFLEVKKATGLSELERYLRFTAGEIIMPTKAACLGAVGHVTSHYALEARWVPLPSLGGVETGDDVKPECKAAMITAARAYVTANHYSVPEQQTEALKNLKAEFIEFPVFETYRKCHSCRKDKKASCEHSYMIRADGKNHCVAIEEAVDSNTPFDDDWKDRRPNKTKAGNPDVKFFKFYRAEGGFYMTGFTDVTSEDRKGESHAHIVVTTGKEVWNPKNDALVPDSLIILRTPADVNTLLALSSDSQRTVFIHKPLITHKQLGPIIAHIKANAGKGRGGKNWPKTEKGDRSEFDRVVLPPGVVLRIVMTTETTLRVDLLCGGVKMCPTETIKKTETTTHIVKIE